MILATNTCVIFCFYSGATDIAQVVLVQARNGAEIVFLNMVLWQIEITKPDLKSLPPNIKYMSTYLTRRGARCLRQGLSYGIRIRALLRHSFGYGLR
jgi:hypothetical protein